MSVLNSMVRVHSWMLDEKRQKLVELERFVDKMKADLVNLEANLEKEREAAARSYEARQVYGAFIRAALARRRKLQETIANLEREVELARDEVQEAFQEVKKFETARHNAEQREEIKERRREQLTLDELGVSLYRRRKASGEGGE